VGVFLFPVFFRAREEFREVDAFLREEAEVLDEGIASDDASSAWRLFCSVKELSMFGWLTIP